MKHLRLYEEFDTEYKGYLTGTLPYLHKHKLEIQKKIDKLQGTIQIYTKTFGRLMNRNRMEIVFSCHDEIRELKKELEEVEKKMATFKRKVDENKKD